LQDEELSELLNLSLEREGQNDLRNRIMTGGVLKEDDFKTLEKYRKEVKAAVDASKEILNKLTPETIKIIADQSPEFNQLVGTVGVQNVKKFFRILFI